MKGLLRFRRSTTPRAVGALAICALGCDSPVAPADAMAFRSVAAGAEHSCAVTADGSAWCWGRGTEGQLGHLGHSDESRPVRVAGPVRFVQLDGGSRHTCGVTAEGEAHCWGWGHYGQLGHGATHSSSGPTRVSDDRYVSVNAGGNHTCAITAAGAIHCWGENGQGQLGDGTTTSRHSPVPVAAGTLTFAEVSAGSFHTCARSIDNRVFCWGLNHVGQLGTGSLVGASVPTEVASDRLFRSVSAGVSHTCGVSTEGVALCWGSSEFGELGTGGLAEPGFTGATQPTATILGYSFASVSAGNGFTCGLQPGNVIACWGRGVEGQFGNGQPIIMPVPLPNTYGPRASAIAVGSTHGCLISTGGQVLCWGSGGRGQLGTGHISATTLPTRVNIPRE